MKRRRGDENDKEMIAKFFSLQDKIVKEHLEREISILSRLQNEYIHNGLVEHFACKELPIDKRKAVMICEIVEGNFEKYVKDFKGDIPES